MPSTQTETAKGRLSAYFRSYGIVANSVVLVNFLGETRRPIIAVNNRFYSVNGVLYLTRNKQVLPGTLLAGKRDLHIFPTENENEIYQVNFEPDELSKTSIKDTVINLTLATGTVVSVGIIGLSIACKLFG